MAQPATESGQNFAPRAHPVGSLLFLAGAGFTALTLHGGTPSGLAHYASIGIGLSLLASMYMDSRAGLLNLVRPDLMAIFALYFLTLFEFLFPQVAFDQEAGLADTREAIIACIVGFSGMVIGRHLPNVRKHPLKKIFLTPTPPGLVIFIFVACVILGSLNMLIAVDFSVPQLFHYFVAPRFSQPWSRERLGDWKALLHELELILQLVPPIAGVIFGRRKKFNGAQLFITACGLFYVLFFGFSGGTRNVFATYLVTFLIGYAFAMPRGRTKELIVVSAACAVLLVVSSVLMLQFRDEGLATYANGGYRYNVEHASEESLFIDYNLYAISRIVGYIHGGNHYLGWEIPYQALIRVVPRALWHGKPEALSISVEDIMNVSNLTIATSFVGEAYLSWGLIGVLIAGLFFGTVTGWWSHLASARNSELGILIYASGFLAAVISMRSVLVFTTAVLPTLAAIGGGWVLVKLIAAVKAKPRPVPRRQLQRGPVPRGPLPPRQKP
ncbi:MAG TPA: O-antigen polymerase [Chthoniobacteraceae bacterium]|nr:O-antigen polymerase [Chthoniobacteraceae bacterium]